MMMSAIIYGLHNLKCLDIGTTKTIIFPFVPNGILMFLDVPIFKHIRVYLLSSFMILHNDELKPQFAPSHLVCMEPEVKQLQSL